MATDPLKARSSLKVGGKEYAIYRLDRVEEAGYGKIERLPFSVRVLLEAVVRHAGEPAVSDEDVRNLASWAPKAENRPAMPFFPGRVIMQDFTGVPVVVDLAAMRAAMKRLGGDVSRVNPLIPVDLVIDHSVQVDFFGTPQALQLNADLEFQRNHERYELLHWAQNAFDNLTVVPPSTGIVHQVNLEYLGKVVLTRDEDGKPVAFPDTLVGTDSHTTMINGIGVVGWGVGGIEATAGMLGQPLDMLIPDVIGFKLTGKLREGATPTDLTLTITQMLRKKGVVEKFVEFFGPGLTSLAVTDRAMIANMSPENGATITFFPVDEKTLDYLRQTGRPEDLVKLVEAYCKAQGLFRTDETPDPVYTDTLELDLGTVEPSLAGPKRPQDRVPLGQMKTTFESVLSKARNEGGYAVSGEDLKKTAKVKMDGGETEMAQGAVAIAAITSCTNTSNPFVMVGAGLLAKKAVEKGLKVKPYVKTSLAPGSRVVTDYLEKAGVMQPLAELGFDLVGYGCTTCIGNSGPLDENVSQAIAGANLVAAAVLSGNRNFEGRINPQTQANYLASPPLVVAYALAGTVDIDLATEPVGIGRDDQPVYLKDIWPSSQEVLDLVASSVDPEMFRRRYADVLTGNQTWNEIESGKSESYEWDPGSTYIQEPPYFAGMTATPPDKIADIHGARVLAVLGDSITTDHISPAGAIPSNSAAGRFLVEHGVEPKEFNSFGSRRGNDRVMTRGTFGNIRLKNQLVPGVEGSFTRHLPDGEQMTIFDAAMKYKEEGLPLVVLAGKEYGTGSSRDWAAKGPLLLGVRAVIAESFERIHRSNLVGMGILPLVYKPGQNAQSLGLTGRETFDIEGFQGRKEPGGEVIVRVHREDGSETTFPALVRIDTRIELDYYRRGGIMNAVLYEMMKK
jgi:aconitate hydratase